VVFISGICLALAALVPDPTPFLIFGVGLIILIVALPRGGRPTE